MKAVADVVEEASSAHKLERLFYHVKGIVIACSLPVAEQKKKGVRSGEFRGNAESAVF